MSEHNHDGSCGCGHDHELEYDTITLSLDDGTELSCAVLEIFSVDGKDYIALQPEEGEEEDNVFLYRYIEDENEPQLLNIEDDDEFEAVADAFEEILDSQEYDEMFDEDFDEDEIKEEE